MKNFVKKLLFLLTCALFVGSAFAQRQTVTGVVKDANGPIIGASIIVDGTTTGVSTNVDGEFSISVTPSQVLVVSYIGYTTAEVPVGSRSHIVVELQEDAEVLEDVVVIGYGTVRRSDLSGSVASVKPDELLSTPSGSASDMLRGRATGVVVTSSSGRPGSDSDILIRGSRSLSSSNTPLIVIDGIASTSGEFNAMNSNDIASIEILKDAAAQAVYGARAANGVVLVTTKRGESETAKVTFDSYVSLNSLWRNFDFWTPDEFFELRAQALANDMATDMTLADPSVYSAQDILSDAVMYESYLNGDLIDWESLMMRDYSVTQSYSVGVSQAYKNIKYSLGAGFFDQEGIARYDSNYKRGNFRANIEAKVNKRLSVGVNTSYQKNETVREDGSLNEYITLPYWGTVYNEDGSFSQLANAEDRNPLHKAANYERIIITDRFRISPFVEFRPIESLTYRLNASMYSMSSEDGEYYASDYYGGGSIGSIDTDENKNYQIENIVTWVAPLKNKDHELSLTGVQSLDHSVSRALDVSADNIPVDYEHGWNMIADGTVTGISRSYTESILISFLARAQYSYKGRYILSAAMRRDGSSKFGANTKWGNFPSVSGAWRISEESFMENTSDVLSNLKLRLSYGQVGNQNGIGSYSTLGNATSYDMEFGNEYIMGYLPSSELSNPNLKWETTETSNFGVDFGFFNNRLTGSIEGYFTRTTDLLVEQTINSATGYESMLTNLGETQTRGIEIALSGDIIRKKDFVWNASINFSKSVNEIININGEKDANGNYLDDSANNWFIGESINVYYDYVSDGIYQLDDFEFINGSYVRKPTVDTDGDGIGDQVLEYSNDSSIRPGYVKLKDLNGDGAITEADRTTYDRDQDYVMSFTSSFTYKGFDLFMDWYYSHGGIIRNSYLYDVNYGGSLNGASNGVARDYWTVDNPTNDWPAPSVNTDIGEKVTLAYQDMTYIRLRTLSLGYTVPKDIVSKINLSRVKVYVSATNLFTDTDVLSYSPELSTGSYPETRQVVFGLNLEF